MIWVIAIDAGKDGHDQVNHPKQSDCHRENDGNQLVDCEKKDHQADKKYEQRDVKEHYNHRNRMVYVISQGPATRK